MDCQRHNSEAVIKGMEEKLKEKEKGHRCVKKFNELIVLFWTVDNILVSKHTFLTLVP